MEPSEREKELTIKVTASLGVIKLVCGVGNNIASLCLYNAIDAIKRTPKYRHLIKKLVNEVDRDYRTYESCLKYPNKNSFFDIRYMSDNDRKLYSDDMTNEDYFELWTSLCFYAYEENKDSFTCLQHKYYKFLVNHGVKYAEEYQYAMLAMTTLEIANKMYESALEMCIDSYSIPKQTAKELYSCFSLEKITNKYRKLLDELIPEIMTVEITPEVDKDVYYGIEQLEKKLINLDSIFLSGKRAVEENEEFMRTKGTQKKVIREYEEMRMYAQGIVE